MLSLGGFGTMSSGSNQGYSRSPQLLLHSGVKEERSERGSVNHRSPVPLLHIRRYPLLRLPMYSFLFPKRHPR